jgi:hypothetical protein
LGSDISNEAEYRENNNRPICGLGLIKRRVKAPRKETDEIESLHSNSTSKTSMWVKKNKIVGNIQAAIITFSRRVKECTRLDEKL